MWRAPSRTPYGCSGSPPICCCSPGWTRGSGPQDARFDLAELVREEADGRAAVHLDGVHLDGVRALEVAGSRSQLARVLANLLDNAQRHARERIDVALRTEGEWAVLEVADDGSGVPPGERERIFERFVRLDEARSRDGGGAGLGLAIARDVAVRHGGTLTVGQAPKGGALFALRCLHGCLHRCLTGPHAPIPCSAAPADAPRPASGTSRARSGPPGTAGR